MNILLVGSGGREHALAWKIGASPLTRRLVCAPGNPGMAALAEVRSVRVTDANAMIVTCHLFDSDGQGLGVATLGPGEATAEKTQQAIVELDAIVSCGTDAGGTASLDHGLSPE